MSSASYDLPDWQRHPIAPFANLNALGHVGGGQDLLTTTPIGGGLAGVVVVYSTQTSNATVTIRSLPSNTVLFTSNTGDSVQRTRIVTLDQLVAGDNQLQFEATATGASAEAIMQAYAITDSSLVFTDSRFPLVVSQAAAQPGGAPSKAVEIDWGAPAGGTLTPIAGVVRQVIRVFGLAFWFDAAAAAGQQLHVKDTAGGPVWKVPETSTLPPTPINLGGFPLPAGLGLELVSDAGVAVRGIINYSQA